ncbi:S46 family peptidase [Coralloluteibacterium thermophilus]|uniref:Dipeptidyl-peptidase n=1 Tax=Coralloluteibacterium thermophilum TaxID=2707049 RepID=A0ABV9NN98_9GAMM
MSRRTAVAVAFVLACGSAAADEGMWLPAQLPEIADSLRAAGYQGDPAELADLTRAPLNAVVRVGGGTGAFVSPEGLVLTNHHVALGVVQYNSGEGRDLIETGYVAADRHAELPANPDYRVLVTTGFENVTGRVLAEAQGRTGRDYYDAVDRASKALVAECEAQGDVRCSVETLFHGRDFYRVTQLELRDIRLVYAPPRGIGNYGDEIDNFMWPRHSGDFTLLRAYVGPDGRPADPSADNVPYAPPSHLRLARDGLAEGDFAMLAGYPGITYRHRTAAEFDEQVNWRLPAQVEVLDALIATIEAAGAGNADARTRYASQLASLKNGSKRFTGELEGLLRSDAVRERAEDERGMLAAADGTDLAAIRALQASIAAASAQRERDLLVGYLGSQTQLLRAALTLERLRMESARPDAERERGYQARDHGLIEGQLRQVQRRYAPEVETALLRTLLTRYQRLPDAQRLPELDAAFGRTPEALDAVLARLYGGTALGTEAERLARFEAARAGRGMEPDPLLDLAAALTPALQRLEDARKAREGEQLRLRPAYMHALVAWRRQQGRAVYPDANRTLRVSYGRVESLAPRDAVRYAPLTRVEGIVEKNTGKAPFDAPQPLLDAIAARRFGDYVEPAIGSVPVNFLTNLDTTGGNSGSPVLNARGELVGLNFDSNWESVSASWKFDPRYKRAIHVDMRYMRWLMDEVYPAPHLLRELGVPAAR